MAAKKSYGNTPIESVKHRDKGADIPLSLVKSTGLLIGSSVGIPVTR